MGRELPHNTEAEQSILDTIMTYPSVVSVAYSQGLDVRDFYLDIHQRIFSAMMGITDSGKPVDVTTLIAHLQDIEQPNLISGADYIIKLSDTTIFSTNSVCYIEVVRDRAHLRCLIEITEQTVEDGFDTASGLDEIMDKVEQDILSATYSRRATDFKSDREVVSNVMQELIHLHISDNHVTGTKTGYADFDRVTNGFRHGDLIILAAHPATGKTTFALDLTLNASLYNLGAVTVFSLEIPVEALIKHILSARSAVEPNRLRNGAALDDEFSRLNEAANELVVNKLFVDDNPNIKISGVFSRCRKLRSEHGLDLVVVDYPQLISGSGKSEDNRQQEILEVSRPLKGLVREMECPVIALSQLSRSVETCPDKRPMLPDLREPGAIEQDVDTVMFLHRDAYYAEDDEAGQNNLVDQTDLDIAKHRNGVTGKVELVFQGPISASFNIVHDGFSQCQVFIM